MPEVLIDPRCTLLGIRVTEPPDTTRVHWRATHVWLTVNGNWDDVPQWAKPFQKNYLGGATNIFMLGYKLDGTPTQSKVIFIQGWPDGIAKFSPEAGNGYWGNAMLVAGFDWSKTTGPYYGQMNAISTSVVRGMGLPYPPLPWETADAQAEGGVHVSYFIVMQEMAAEEPEPEPEDGHLEHLDAVLAKAEAVADRLASIDVLAGDLTQVVAAAGAYLGIANVLLELVIGGS